MYSRTILRAIKNYQVNIIIKVLIFSDFMIWSSYQLFAPIFAIFITDKISNGGIETVGIAMAIYMITKSIFEMPVGMYIDKSKSEKDDLLVAIIGTALTALVYVSYIFIDAIYQLYILQAILGLGAAISFPGWYAIFTRHIDKGKEAFEWSLYDVFLGFGMAAAAAIGGLLADRLGFDVVFILAGSFTALGSLSLFLIKSKVYKN